MRETRPKGSTVLLHWFLVAEVSLLIITGLWLRFSHAGVPFGLSRFLHLTGGYALFPILAFRIYWTFFGELRLTAPAEQLRLYAGARELVAHYWIYMLKWTILGLAVLTGLALRFPAQPVFAWLLGVLGSALRLRLWHYILAWSLLSAVALHAYQTYLWDGKRMALIFLPPREDRAGGPGRVSET